MFKVLLDRFISFVGNIIVLIHDRFIDGHLGGLRALLRKYFAKFVLILIVDIVLLWVTVGFI